MRRLTMAITFCAFAIAALAALLLAAAPVRLLAQDYQTRAQDSTIIVRSSSYTKAQLQAAALRWLQFTAPRDATLNTLLRAMGRVDTVRIVRVDTVRITTTTTVDTVPTVPVVTAPPVTGTNEPAGFTPQITAAFAIAPNISIGAPNTEGLWIQSDWNPQRQAIVTDAERGSVYEITFPTGMSGGAAPGKFRTKPFAANTGSIYFRYYVKFSAGFSYVSNRTLPGGAPDRVVEVKSFFLRDAAGLVNTFTAFHASEASPNAGFHWLTTQTPWSTANVAVWPPVQRGVNDGKWHRIEVLIERNAGTNAGRFRDWIDGVLVNDFSNVVGAAPGPWGYLQFEPTFGGANCPLDAQGNFLFSPPCTPVPQTQTIRLDDLYVSVK